MNINPKKILAKALSKKTLGILGGGQLGKMIGMAASKLGIKVIIFDPKEDSPAFQIADKYYISSFEDKEKTKIFARECDAITYEFENVPLECLIYISKFSKIYPGIFPLKISQDRVLEKNFIHKLNINVADFSVVKSKKDIKNFLIKRSNKMLLKTVKQGYDGRGQKKIDLRNYKNQKISFKKNNFIAEKIILFKKEISVIVIRDKQGRLTSYNPSENNHREGILIESNYPAKIEKKTEYAAKSIAKKIARELNIVGVLAVEMFITRNNEIIVNEIAPRPHNSGHWTMDVCNISQFDALVRVIFDLPINYIKYYHKCKMINILGENYEQFFHSLEKAKHKIHIYGKSKIKPKRKMGHVNIID